MKILILGAGLGTLEAFNTDTTSMARTTGYTAALTVRLIAEGLYAHKGISPPEYMGRNPACVAYLKEGLIARGVEWLVTEYDA